MSLRRTLAIARAEWIHNLRDPRSLFVIVALPVLLLLLYGYGINYDLEHIPFAVQDLDGTALARDVILQFTQSRYFSLRHVMTDRRDIDRFLDRGEVAFVLVIPPGLERTVCAGRPSTVQVVLDGADTTRANVALGYIESALQDYSTRLGVEYAARQGITNAAPLDLHVTILYNPDLKSVRFIVPGLIAILLTILAGLLTSTCIVREREWGSFEGLVTSPARATEILVGKMTPYVGIAFADVLLSIFAGSLVFGVFPRGSMALLLAASTLYLIASLAIGVIFSVMARTQRVAILLATLATLLPSILLSGFAFPVRSMPAVLQAISTVIPATHFLIVIRAIYLKGVGIAVLWPRVLALAAFALVVVFIAARKFRKQL